MTTDLIDNPDYMPLPESFDSKEKLYYSMGETCEIFQLPASTLRYWEKEFDVLKPRKNKKGDRFFSKNDIALIRTIHYLTKVKGYTIQGARDALKNNFIQEADNATIIASLTEIKEMLLKIKKELD
ncbi:MAG: MerR family transcriptional regulator [Bacteroidales bacterium]|jgi:DNA-binding transcriptional MerR regulator|nr:MerR family transcriptional regulator [Bacteroidales bacterium]MBR0078486.1 MerR family transcriptional regulator [Bacteroidales bacterium]